MESNQKALKIMVRICANLRSLYRKSCYSISSFSPTPLPLGRFMTKKKKSHFIFNKIGKVVPKQALGRKQGYAGYETQMPGIGSLSR